MEKTRIKTNHEIKLEKDIEKLETEIDKFKLSLNVSQTKLVEANRVRDTLITENKILVTGNEMRGKQKELDFNVKAIENSIKELIKMNKKIGDKHIIEENQKLIDIIFNMSNSLKSKIYITIDKDGEHEENYG